MKPLPFSHSCFVIWFFSVFFFSSSLLTGFFTSQISPEEEFFGTVYGRLLKFLLWFWGTSFWAMPSSFPLFCAHVNRSILILVTCLLINLLLTFFFLVFPPFILFLSECWGAKKCISSYCSSTSSSFEQYIFGDSGLHLVLPDICVGNSVYVCVVLCAPVILGWISENTMGVQWLLLQPQSLHLGANLFNPIV